jgi:tryptophanyl-tRNA synthetase
MPKRVFSGVQPSGALHLGVYLGAIKQFVGLQNDHDVIYCVVDEHAITVPQEPEGLRRETVDVARAYLAAGVDPKRSTIFIQSHVPAHTELGWILNTMTPMGELERMTQFKEKGRKQRAGVFAGLFNYPTLMAADILLYHTAIVPVGEDQRQHIELTRSLAERFNNRYGETFTIPEAQVKRETARILSLTNPAEKMSKSDESDKSRVNLLDSADAIREKIKSAVTDSDKEVRYDLEEKPAISNLLVIFSEFSGKSIKELEKIYDDKSYADFKSDLAEVVIDGLRPFQERFRELSADSKSVLEILRDGSEKAAVIANKTLADVKQKIGFL